MQNSNSQTDGSAFLSIGIMRRSFRRRANPSDRYEHFPLVGDPPGFDAIRELIDVDPDPLMPGFMTFPQIASEINADSGTLGKGSVNFFGQTKKLVESGGIYDSAKFLGVTTKTGQRW
jgi:hypothetical protein